MDRTKTEERRKIVREELKELADKKYIEENTFFHVSEAHNKYYDDREQAKKKAKVLYNEKNNHVEQKEAALPKIEKAKKALSPQEIRERNITWSLNLGVILLLIGGLVLATSTWDTLGNWMKTGLIALVSVMFFGLAWFTMRILKIEKTAFAFYVLGALFLPIVILSAGYFALLGNFFSFSGVGRYLYGSAGGLVVLPVYIFLSIKLDSRLFVWFSYITLTVFAGLVIASLYLPIDGFYLGIMMFNAALIIGYHYLKKNERLRLFTKEFVLYVQGNLILSTLLMLAVYDNALLYSFNLLLTAVLYFAMIFVTKHKEYHIIFSAMLVYGAYQLIEFSALNEVESIAYALIGFVFLALPGFLKNHGALHIAFRYTSAIVSFFAFLYISLEGILLRSEPSIALMIAYVIIAVNFTYLSNKVRRKLFFYLAPLFFMTALYEAVLLGKDVFGYGMLSLPIFVVGFFLYVTFGCVMKLGFFQPIKGSSRDVGGIVMLFCVLGNYGFIDWWQLSTMFLLLAVTTLFMARFEDREIYTKSSLASWGHAVSLGLAIITCYTEVSLGNKSMYLHVPLETEGFILAGIIVLLVSFVWRKFNRKVLDEHSFFVAHGFYLIGMLMTFSFTFDEFMRSVIVLGGIGMAYLLYRKTNWIFMPYILSGITLWFYLTVLYTVFIQFTIESDLYQALQFNVGALVLLATGLLVGKKDRLLMQSFLWVGHLYLPLALVLTFGIYGYTSVWAFIVAAAIYWVSVQKAKLVWLIHSFLYLFCTSLWIGLHLGLRLMELGIVHYSFLIVSIGLAVAWYMSKGLWARKIAYYTVPFSFIGVIATTLEFPYNLVQFIITLLYIVLMVFIMHREKWDIYNVIPLLTVFYALGVYGSTQFHAEYFMLFAVAGFAVIYTVVGILIYPTIYQKSIEKAEPVVIDWYTIIGFLALCGLYGLTTEVLGTKLLPGFLISVNLLAQRNRIPYIASKWFVFLACAFLVQPYYTILMNTNVPALIEREMYVLPWILLAIYLKKITERSHKTVINAIQWFVLIIVSLLLIQDGMASNTIYDALIVGTLSLASMLGGMFYQLKSFFFIGSGVLLLNVFIQTKPYWGNMPWWGYLLIAGSILITVASYNEWHKQKTSDGKQTLISIFNKKVVKRIKKWE